MAPTPRMQVCGGLSTGVNQWMPWPPRFETVKLPPSISSGASVPARALSMASARSLGQLGERHGVSGSNDRHQECLAGVDGEAEVDVRELLDPFPVEPGVGCRVLSHSTRGRKHDQVVQTNAGPGGGISHLPEAPGIPQQSLRLGISGQRQLRAVLSEACIRCAVILRAPRTGTTVNSSAGAASRSDR